MVHGRVKEVKGDSLMHKLWAFVCLFGMASLTFGQGDRGTITGTVADPAGAVVAGASIEATNIETGGVYPSQTTSTGNYTIAQLPAGTYQVSVNVPGFKKYVRQGIVVQVAQVLRVDVGLEVGSAAESVTVNEAVAEDRKRGVEP
jgi:hypothetical protein